MTIHYHGTPISPIERLYELKGRNFCISHAVPRDVERAHALGQTVMLDNGAYSKWKRQAQTDWPSYYRWCEKWLDCSTTWAVIPDEIGAGQQMQDAMIREWPFGHRGAPVWHMDESIERLVRLTENWPLVCIGSTEEYRSVRSPIWMRRMDEAWNALSRVHRFTPKIHMLRGMKSCGHRWPFYSVDSTDVAQSHHRIQNTPLSMVTNWDARQCAIRWVPSDHQMELIA